MEVERAGAFLGFKMKCLTNQTYFKYLLFVSSFSQTTSIYMNTNIF